MYQSAERDRYMANRGETKHVFVDGASSPFDVLRQAQDAQDSSA